MNESTKEMQAASYAVTASEAWSWTADQLSELNRKLDKPFGEVERVDQALAFVLWKSGYEIEYFSEGRDRWISSDCPMWGDGARYRILPHREVV